MVMQVGVAAAQDMQIPWFTMDGGGSSSTGGTLTLSGTVGQADAGRLSGGNFTLVGGFWAGDAGRCVGDVNADRRVDLADLATLLTNFGTVGGGSLSMGDVNRDGDIDLTDLAMMLTQFGTICPS